MDDEWAKLRAAWQATAPSPTELERSMVAARRRMRVAIAAEWVAGAVLVAFWVGQAIAKPHPVVLVLGLGSLVFVVVWMVNLHRTFGGVKAGGSVGEHLRGAVDLARRQARWYRFAGRSLGVFVAFASLVMPWKAYVDRAMYLAEPWRAVVGFGGFFALTGVVGLLIRAAGRKSADEAVKLEAAARAFEE